MKVSKFTQSIGLQIGALAIEQPFETLKNRILYYQKYSYTLSDLLSPLARSVQSLVFSLFTGSFLQHVKLYTEDDCFYHTNVYVKADKVHEKYDRFFLFYNPQWEEIRKRYIGPLHFASTEALAAHVSKNISLFLKTAADKKCRTDVLGIILTPLHRYLPAANRSTEEKKRYIDKLPESSEMFTCTQLQTRAFLYAGVDLFPGQNHQGIYPNDFTQSHCFAPIPLPPKIIFANN
jgi:hypothetical protein